MVEFIITTSFILLPLFLVLPYIAKYIEIQQYNVQAARYEVWEYTAWFRASADVPKSFNDGGTLAGMVEANKSVLAVQNESRKRFFANSKNKIKADDHVGLKSTDINPFLARDYKDNQILEDTLKGAISYNQSTPDLSSKLTGGAGIVSGIIDVVSAVSGFLGTEVPGAGSLVPTFSVLNSSGYQQTSIEIPINNAPAYTDMQGVREPLLGRPLNLTFSAQAALLSEGWNAGGRDHAKIEAEALVPTRVLRSPFEFVMQIFDVFPFSTFPVDELKADSLIWGHTDSEAIPPEFLDSDEETECDDNGYCFFPEPD